MMESVFYTKDGFLSICKSKRKQVKITVSLRGEEAVYLEENQLDDLIDQLELIKNQYKKINTNNYE